jgi:hypothetical protein
MRDRPQARSEGVYVELFDDELVVYDRATQTAHSLSAAAARVWEACDGHRSAVDIAEQLGLAPDLVAQALAELDECRLLDDGPALLEANITRRQAAKRLGAVGGAAFAAPLIYSVTVGPASAAASPLVCDANPCMGTDPVEATAVSDADAQCAVAPGCQPTSTCVCTPFFSSGEYFCSGQCAF